MARPRKRQRRSFGKLRTIVRSGHEYIEASYLTPLWAFGKWPNLPKRQYKIVQPEFETEAVAWLNRAEREIKLEAWTPPQLEREEKRRQAVTFSEYAKQWLDSRRRGDGSPIRETTKQKHREALRLYLYPAFGDKRMTDITAKDVQAWWDGFKPERAGEGASLEARRVAVYSTLRAIMGSAAKEPIDDDGTTLIKANPCNIRALRGDAKHQVVIAEVDQLQALYEAFPAWLRLGVYLSGYLGLREGEVLGLQRHDIDLSTMTLHVRRAAKTEEYENGTKAVVLGPPKTRSSVRDVAIPEFLAQPITDHLSQRVGKEPDALLFPAQRTGGVCSGQTFRNAFNRAKTKVPALAGMRPHDLRDTALTRLAAMGATNGELMRQAGHRTLAVASKYQHRVQSHYDTVLDNLENVVTSASAPPVDAGNMPQQSDGTPREATPASVSTTDDATPAPQPEPSPDTSASAGEAPQREPQNGPQADEHDELGPLAAMLGSMPLEARVAVLKGLDVGERLRVLQLLDSAAQIETMQQLIKEAA